MFRVHELPGKLPNSKRYIVNGYSYNKDVRCSKFLLLRCSTRTRYPFCVGAVKINPERTEIISETEHDYCVRDDNLFKRESFILECIKRAQAEPSKDYAVIFREVSRE